MSDLAALSEPFLSLLPPFFPLLPPLPPFFPLLPPLLLGLPDFLLLLSPDDFDPPFKSLFPVDWKAIKPWSSFRCLDNVISAEVVSEDEVIETRL